MTLGSSVSVEVYGRNSFLAATLQIDFLFLIIIPTPWHGNILYLERDFHLKRRKLFGISEVSYDKSADHQISRII